MGVSVRFASFEVDLDSRELRKRGIRLHLADQSFEILAILVERPGDVITREEIRDRLWPHGTVVEFEHSVNSAVRRLRDCLGDSATTPRFIETLPRRGYRFVAPLETGASAPSSPHFRILGELGQGGMGVVYRAEDLILGRTVALKFLPEDLARHPPSVERFRREARTVASLNHPGICALYGVEEHEGRLCLVMEYLEGQPLSRLMEGGPLALKQALRIAAQTSEALAAAHSLGIAHHDITPANIFVTRGGQVKILDFGLAEVTRQDAAKYEASPRRPAANTEDDRTASVAVDGTTAYLSPEQVRGEAVDAQSDIFSFGLVLYEMLTGKHPFRKESPTETASAILHDEQRPAGVVAKGIPADLDRLISGCLRKEADRRIQHMDDVKLALEQVQGALDSGKLQIAPHAWKRVSSVGLAAAVAGLLVFIAAGWYWLSRQHPAEPEAQLSAVPLTSYPGYESAPSFDPLGTQVAFQWCPDGPEANCDIYIKQIGIEEQPFRLTTDPAKDFSPAWSPDGRFIAFLRKVVPTRVALIIIPQRGGQERVMSDFDWLGIWGDELSYLAWTPDSKWIACQQTEDAQTAGYLLNIETRGKRSMPTLVRGQPYGPPAFSPDGRMLAFSSRGLFLLHLAEGYLPRGEPERIVPEPEQDSLTRARAPASNVAWMPDGKELLFISQRSFWRVPASASVSPRRIALDADNACTPAVSGKGNRLAYAVVHEDDNIWRVDLPALGSVPGAPVPFISSTRMDRYPAYSPDGRRIAFNSNRSGTSEIWVCDRDGSNLAKLTSTGYSMWPRWSPDGRNIAFTSGIHVWVIDANGGAARRLTTDSAPGKWPWWSRDGKSIYLTLTRGGSAQIAKMPATGGEAIPITAAGDRDVPKESPDGRFIYYQRGWPEHCSVWRVPAGSGEETMVLDSVHRAGLWTVWEQGIYFFRPADENGRSEICLYEFATGKIRKIQTIERPVSYSIAASPDGRTILYSQTDQSGSDLMLVENFR